MNVSALRNLQYPQPRPAPSARPVVGYLQVWNTAAIDALTESVVTRLLVGGEAARVVAVGLAADLAQAQPDLPALSLSLPFSLAASAIEEMLGAGPEARAAAVDCWRVAALIGADALVLGVQGEDSVAALDRYWKAGDEVFGAGSRDFGT